MSDEQGSSGGVGWPGPPPTEGGRLGWPAAETAAGSFGQPMVALAA